MQEDLFLLLNAEKSVAPLVHLRDTLQIVCDKEIEYDKLDMTFS